MNRSFLAGLAVPCVLAAACGSSSTGPGTGTLTGKDATEVLALAQAAMTAANQSFHFVDETKQGSSTVTLIGDDTSGGAHQTVEGSISALEVLRTASGGLYVRGASVALERALGLSTTVAAANAGKWISLQPDDAPYTTVAVALDPQKEIESYIPTAPLQLEKPRDFRGRVVIGVTGAAPSSAASGTGKTVTLYVPTKAPYTPLGATLSYGSGSTSGIEAVVFGDWGETINPSAPSGAVPYSSLVS